LSRTSGFVLLETHELWDTERADAVALVSAQREVAQLADGQARAWPRAHLVDAAGAEARFEQRRQRLDRPLERDQVDRRREVARQEREHVLR
jgi:hypothetical protein